MDPRPTGYRRINIPLKLHEDMKRLLESRRTPYRSLDELAREAVSHMIREEIEGGRR